MVAANRRRRLTRRRRARAATLAIARAGPPARARARAQHIRNILRYKIRLDSYKETKYTTPSTIVLRNEQSYMDKIRLYYCNLLSG